MSEIQGYYYLHTNKDLIYKPGSDVIIDIRESDFCHSAWAWDGERATAWQILVEASSLGADPIRIGELVAKWKCDDEDAEHYAHHIGIELGVDGNQKTAHKKDFINLQESPCGFGNTNLQAMSDLCRQLGFKGGKMWNATFESLVQVEHQPEKEG